MTPHRPLLPLAVLTVAMTLLAGPAWGQVTDAGRPVPPAPTVFTLTASSAPEPVPALGYRLLPPWHQRKPGNAAILLLQAVAESQRQASKDAPVDDWLKMPLDQIPRQQAQDVLTAAGQALRLTEMAALREDSDWQVPLREQGIATPLPPLGSFREIAKLLALRARLQIAEGDFDEALHSLQTGMGMARHIACEPIIISKLVAVAIDTIMLRVVQEWIDTPGSPNLYWALTALPDPLVDMGDAFDVEASWLYWHFPDLQPFDTLREAVESEWSEQEWPRMLQQLNELFGIATGEGPLGEKQSQLTTTAITLKLYPPAKRWLIEQGYDPQRVEKMPVLQVVALYSLGEYERLRDDMFKWAYVPYPAARQGWAKAEQALAQAKREMRGYPFTALLPSLSRATQIQAELVRNVDALRVIEAVRMYAADHDGQLPATLADIEAVPVPENAVTGEPFGYEVTGDTFTLIAEGVPEDPTQTRRYVVTVEPADR